MKAAFAAAILLAAPGAGFAGDGWEKSVAIELGYTQLAMSAGGWTLQRQYEAGSLPGAGSGYVPVYLGGGEEYAVVALCDAHCGDIDLALYDPDDALLSEDCREAGLPIVRVTPAERGRYDLEVRMIACAEEACNYSVAVFSRPAPAAFSSR